MPDFDDEKKLQDQKGNILYTLIVIVILVVGGFFLYYKIITPELDADACPVKGPYSEHVVLFDQTDTAKDKPIVEMDARNFLEKISPRNSQI